MGGSWRLHAVLHFLRNFQKKKTYEVRKMISGCLGLRVGMKINSSTAQGVVLGWCKYSRAELQWWLPNSIYLQKIIEVYTFNEHILWYIEHLKMFKKWLVLFYTSSLVTGYGLLEPSCSLRQGRLAADSIPWSAGNWKLFKDSIANWAKSSSLKKALSGVSQCTTGFFIIS